mgnify:CR=1 FL=1
MTVVHSSVVDAPREEVFAWHARPGAIHRLMPPWQPMRVIAEAASLADGRAVLGLPGGLRWVAQHDPHGYDAPARFVDELKHDGWRSVPPALVGHWRHEHHFEAVDAGHTRLTDRVETPVPEPVFRQMFRYRHRQLADDLAKYEVSKGGFKFPIGKPPPATLIRKLVKARLAEIEAPKPAKAAKKSAAAGEPVAAYLKSLKHPLKKEIEAARLVILAANPAISEGIKWNTVSFRADKDWFATFNVRAQDSVQLVFHLGAKTRPDLKAFKLADPNGLMKWLGKDRAMVTLGVGRDIPAHRKALEAIVRAWIKHV